MTGINLGSSFFLFFFIKPLFKRIKSSPEKPTPMTGIQRNQSFLWGENDQQGI